MKRYLFTLMILSLLSWGVTVVAQTTEPTQSEINRITNMTYNATVNEGDINVVVNPEYPRAFETVSIRLDSNIIDLNRYLIQWTTDTFEQKSGIGMRDFSLQAGNNGIRKRITVTISGSGTRLVKNITITPQDATLLWEAIDSYVPPFYYGKKQASQESIISLTGIPNFKINNGNELNDAVYLWTRNGNKILNAGGYSKGNLIIQHNKLRKSEEITMDISDVANANNARVSVTIPITNPEINWYYRDIYNYRKPVSINEGLRVGQEDVTIIAEPFFFSLARINDLDFTWKMNDEILYLDSAAPKNELIVRNPEKSGQVSFSVNLKNPRTFLQSTNRSTTLYFQ